MENYRLAIIAIEFTISHENSRAERKKENLVFDEILSVWKEKKSFKRVQLLSIEKKVLK